MPNINEFLNKPERIFPSELERIGGAKPCSKCIFGMHLQQLYPGNALTDIKTLTRWDNVRKIRSKT